MDDFKIMNLFWLQIMLQHLISMGAEMGFQFRELPRYSQSLRYIVK